MRFRLLPAVFAVTILASSCGETVDVSDAVADTPPSLNTGSADTAIEPTTTTMRAPKPVNADVENMPSLSGRPEVPEYWRRFQNEASFAIFDAEADDRYERFAPYADQLIYELGLHSLGVGWSVGLDGWGALSVHVATPEQEALAREILAYEIEITTYVLTAG